MDIYIFYNVTRETQHITHRVQLSWKGAEMRLCPQTPFTLYFFKEYTVCAAHRQ